MVNRRIARECVLQALYAHTMGSGSQEHVVETIIRPRLRGDAMLLSFGEKLFRASFETAGRCDELVQAQADNWALVRMALLDRLILRIAVCEFLQFEDIPPKVTINEAIDIAKRFSTELSGKFVNGILDAIISVLQESGELVKTGRGLKGMDALMARLAEKGRTAPRPGDA